MLQILLLLNKWQKCEKCCCCCCAKPAIDGVGQYPFHAHNGMRPPLEYFLMLTEYHAYYNVLWFSIQWALWSSIVCARACVWGRTRMRLHIITMARYVSPGGFSIYIQKSYIIIMKLYLCLFQNKGVDFFLFRSLELCLHSESGKSECSHTIHTHTRTTQYDTHKHSVASLLNLHIVVVMWHIWIWPRKRIYSRFAFGHATNVTHPIGKKRENDKKTGKIEWMRDRARDRERMNICSSV